MRCILLSMFLLAFIYGKMILAQNSYQVKDEYLKIEAKANSPIYTTYTAAMQRSRLYGDKGYKMDYYSSCSPIRFEGDQAGSFFHLFKVNKVVIPSVAEFF